MLSGPYMSYTKGSEANDGDRQQADVSAMGKVKSGDGLWDTDNVHKGLDLTSGGLTKGIMSNEQMH